MAFRVLIFLLTVFIRTGLGQNEEYPPACDHPIYCIPGNGTLLHTVQMARLYPDSKTFVDKPLKFTQDIVLGNFEKLMNDSQNEPSKDQVQKFVDENFLPEGTEFVDWDPEDWLPDPAILDRITDPEYRALAEEIHSRWKDLGRKIPKSLKESKETSLIYLEEPFIVPGGRFREMYYWDSYWTIIGLLQSEMRTTVRGMISNFASLVDRFGFIPNGNRIYYTRRTQPPLFIPMVDEYHKETGDDAFVQSILGHMEAEFKHWMVNRSVSVTVNDTEFKMYAYNVEVDGPRPESYYEDYRDAQKLDTPEDKLEFYMNMKSGAESGWDYSTKWFVGPNGCVSQDITDNQARHIVPVELNSYMCRNSRVLSELFRKFGDTEKAEYYQTLFNDIRNAIDKVLWDGSRGSWFDFDLKEKRSRPYFFPSVAGPLWADCYPQTRLKDKVKPFLAYLKDNQALDYPGGIPTSNNPSGQQWDFPNGWPPLHEIMVTGLQNTGDPEAQDLALSIVKKWVKNIWVSYKQSNDSIFEKYDVNEIGLPGGGGEYEVQEGFGWTNGVLMRFFEQYGDKISSNDLIGSNNSASDQKGGVGFYVQLAIAFVFGHLKNLLPS